MKQRGILSGFLALGVAIAATVVFTEAQAADGKAIVRAVRGKAEFSDSNSGGWTMLKVGKVLKSGAKIRTLNQSQVDLFLGANGPVVRVTEDTELGLDKLNLDQGGADTVIETQLDLTSGRILGRVEKLAAASKYEVKTPQGVAAIKGTEYDISARGAIRVYDGIVVVTGAGVPGGSITLNAGEQWTPGDPGKVPIPPNEARDGAGTFEELNEIIIPTPDGPIVIKPVEPFVSPVTGEGGEQHTTTNDGV